MLNIEINQRFICLYRYLSISLQQKTNKYKIMSTDIFICNLKGNRAAVRDYANTIASMSASNCNAYVMAFDKDNDILWTVQAGDDLDEVKAVINWQGVRRVEIYDHSANGKYKVEQVYITSRKSLNEYTAERKASEFVVISNTTQYAADNWQTEGSYNSDTQSDEDEHNPEITNSFPSWVFIQRTASGDYRHEIRRVPSGFMLFLNVCEATGGGYSTLAVYPTYYEALEALGRFRPTAKLAERINGAGDPATL